MTDAALDASRGDVASRGESATDVSSGPDIASPGHVWAEAARIDDFKLAFRAHPAGIAVITGQVDDGPVGLTASSVASVALDPLALSFSVTRATGTAGALLGAETFVVHLLAARHVDIARSFAVSGAERFTPDQGWTALDTGEPLLADAMWALRCRPLHTVPVGGSTLVIAEVIGIRKGGDGPPLVYVGHRFHALSPDTPDL